MTFYSKLLENILSDSIPAKMGKIGWMEKLVSEMIAEIIDRSFDFREEGTTGMHNAAKAVMRTCEFIENEEDDFSETRYSSGIQEIWDEYGEYIIGYLSEFCLFSYMSNTLEDYLINPEPAKAEMINIIYRSVASEVNDFLWEKFFK